MKQRAIFSFFLVILGTWGWGVPSDIQVKAETPTDDPIPGNQVVFLSLSGKDLKEVKGLRCVLEKAVDDTGKNLLPKESDLTKTNQDWTPVVVDPKTPQYAAGFRSSCPKRFPSEGAFWTVTDPDARA